MDLAYMMMKSLPSKCQRHYFGGIWAKCSTKVRWTCHSPSGIPSYGVRERPAVDAADSSVAPGITWPTKISILLLYRRVFIAVDDVKIYGARFQRLVFVTLGLVVACYVSFETAGIFQCTPVQRSWNVAIPGHCTSRISRMYAYAASNFLTDLVILALPMPVIHSLTHITQRQKIALMGVFAVGGL